MNEARSAIIVPVAIPAAIERVRREHVPVATAGVPPHVTLLSPFVPAARLDGRVRERVSQGLAPLGPFETRFEAVRRFPETLYIAPEPDTPFRRLIVAVCRLFPDLPPYGDPSHRPEDAVPHLTIAIGDEAGFDGLAAEAERSLPFSRRIATVLVIAEGSGGRWRTRWRFSLRA